MGTYIEPFDFKTVLMDLFLGHPSMVFFAVVILISFLSAKFGMSNKNFMLILLITTMMFAGVVGQAIYIIIIVVLGVVVFFGLARLWR